MCLDTPNIYQKYTHIEFICICANGSFGSPRCEKNILGFLFELSNCVTNAIKPEHKPIEEESGHQLETTELVTEPEPVTTEESTTSEQLTTTEAIHLPIECNNGTHTKEEQESNEEVEKSDEKSDSSSSSSSEEHKKKHHGDKHKHHHGHKHGHKHKKPMKCHCHEVSDSESESSSSDSDSTEETSEIVNHTECVTHAPIEHTTEHVEVTNETTDNGNANGSGEDDDDDDDSTSEISKPHSEINIFKSLWEKLNKNKHLNKLKEWMLHKIKHVLQNKNKHKKPE